MEYYVLIVWDDVEPEIEGPFDTNEDRDLRAREIRMSEGDEHGIFRLNIDNGSPRVGAYCGGELEG